MTATLAGYAMAHELRPVKLHDKGCAEVPVPLQLDRVVSGRVVSHDGVPAPGIVVEAVRARPVHENELPRAIASVETDSSGHYTLGTLTTGDYYIGVSLSRPPGVEAPYTRWFHPGTEDPRAAILVAVADRPEAQTIDLRLPPRQNARTIEGRVWWPGAAPGANVQIVLEDPRWPWDVLRVVATADSDGRFQAVGLEGTRYRVRAAGHRDGESFTSGPVGVEPGSAPVHVRLVLNPKAPLKPENNEALEAWRRGQGLR